MKFMFGLQLPLTCKPWKTLSNPCNKVRGKILLKKSSFLHLCHCVFLRASLSLCRCELFYIYMCMYVDVNLHMWLYNTNTLLYKNISLTLYSPKGWCGLCVRGELEMGTDCYILTQSSSFASWLGCSTVGHRGPKPSVWGWFSLRWHPISNCNWNSLTQAVCGTWLYNFLTFTCFRYLHRYWLTARSRVNI